MKNFETKVIKELKKQIKTSYFFQKILLFIGVTLLSIVNVMGQITNELKKDSTQKEVIDTIPKKDIKKYTIRKDTGDIKTTVVYYAEDSIKSNVIDEVVYLYGEGDITYQDINIKAERIIINWRTNTIQAYGAVKDSTNKVKGKPVFKQGDDVVVTDTIMYNFGTKKAVIHNAVTKQEGGILIVDKAKMVDENTMYAYNSKYTTCNLEHPHFFIQSKKIKKTDKAVYSGPFQLFIEDVPTPLGFVFGMFPNIERRGSGIIMPVYGETKDRGFFLRQGGYFWAINDYMNATFLGEIYTNGSWGLNVNSQYKKRYKFDGYVGIRYNKRITGDEGEESIANDFWVNWSHRPQPKRGSSFNASVNFGTSSFNSNNDFNPSNFLSNTFNSSVSYSTLFKIRNKPITLSVSARHDQNTRTEVMNLTLPEVNLGVNRIYPFKKPGGGGSKNALRNINLSYSLSGSMRLSNQKNNGSFGFPIANSEVDKKESNPDDQTSVDFNFENLPYLFDKAQIGIVHNVPISTSLKLLKYFNLNPSMNFQSTWYPKKLDYTWDESKKAVQVDTINTFAAVYSYSLGGNLTTRIFGTFQFDKSKKGRKINAMRHTISPSIGFRYSPSFADPSLGFFQKVQTDSTGTMTDVSRFRGFQPGASINPRESGSINFSVSNIFEMKVRPSDLQNDSSEVQYKKVKLLDNLSILGSYDLLADSLNLSNINLSARTRVANLIDLSFRSTFDPYIYKGDYDDNGKLVRQYKINKYTLSEGQGLANLSSYNIAVGLSLTPEKFRRKTEKKVEEINNQFGTNPNDKINNLQRPGEILTNPNEAVTALPNDPNIYVDFDIPWTLSMNYNMSYNKSGLREATKTQTLNFGGDVSISPTWKIGVKSGFDIKEKALSFTTIDIYKDMHCWEMKFNWIPLGQRQGYFFTINVKASILQDLKLQKQNYWYDRGLR